MRATALSDGSLGLLYADADLADAWLRQLAGDTLVVSGKTLSRPFELAASARGLIRRWNGRELAGHCEFPLETPLPLFDRFPDGRWLVVGSRSIGGPNARALTEDGALISRFFLGDGIEHVGIDADHQIWVGWFDEGVFGNGDWKGDWEWPPSSQGIACFSSDGVPLAPIVIPKDSGGVADCYAMNVGAGGNWFVPYTEFPILNLERERPARWWKSDQRGWWKADLSGARALAVDGAHALVAGGSGRASHILRLVSLDGQGNGERAEVIATWFLPLHKRKPLAGEAAEVAAYHVWEQPSLLSGRGDTLHLIQGPEWRQWRVSDALNAYRIR